MKMCQSQWMGRNVNYVMVTGRQFIPPEAQFSLFKNVAIGEIKRIGNDKQCALIFDTDALING